ncbi:reverse transcriptase domain, reverse transcriptase zinc-binding domain protein [Tanacetum coccineum]
MVPIKEYQPISLIGLQYKIIAKLLANRLLEVIDGVVSFEQPGFIKGCQILDGLSPTLGSEASQFSGLLELIQQLTTSNTPDRAVFRGVQYIWIFKLHSSRTYVVSAMRKHIEESTLRSTTGETKWNNTLPIKVNIFAWRLALDRLPTRFNLDSRRVNLDLVRCTICDDAIEMTQHLFVDCTISKSLWSMVMRWWGFDDHSMDMGNLLKWADTVNLSSPLKECFDAVI